MLVCLTERLAFAYRPDAVLEYRAPDTLADYLRQSNRFSEGRALLRQRWCADVLERYYDPKPWICSARSSSRRCAIRWARSHSP